MKHDFSKKRMGAMSWGMIIVIFLAIAILLIAVFYPFFVSTGKKIYEYVFCSGMGSLLNAIEEVLGMPASKLC